MGTMAPVSDPLVLLVVNDALGVALAAALATRTPPVRCERVSSGEFVERCTSQRADLIVLDADVDESLCFQLLPEVQALQGAPQSIILFSNASDPRRSTIAGSSAWECVVGDQDPLPLVFGLLDRLMRSEARGAHLDAQARQFRALVEASSDGIYILRDGHFSWANRRFEDMVGYTTDELALPTFSMSERITAPDSRAFLAERSRRVDAGLSVEPRYEFLAMRRGGEQFDAQVSIAYLDLEDGKAGALGIMQDITERKRFEALLLQRNKELQQLNALSASVNRAMALDELLKVGCENLSSMLGASAAGISLLSTDRRSLSLRVSESLPENAANALAEVDVASPMLLARVVRSGAIAVVEDVKTDPRISLEAIRGESFGPALVVPLRRRGSGGPDAVVGAAFCFMEEGRTVSEADRDIMIAIGHVLGAAIEQAVLLEAEQVANRKLVALDEIALALASTLDADEISLTVARSTHRLFGAVRVMIARLDVDGDFFVPEHVLDDGEPVAAIVPVTFGDSIMGIATTERRPVQRVRPKNGGEVAIDPFNGKPIALPAYESAMFRQGVGTAVAVPVTIDGVVTGALWLGYVSTTPLPETDLNVLSAIGTHVAIAKKNAALLESRERALEDLRSAQQKLVDSEKLNAIGLIAHGVAHDFNNVLGSILGRAELLRSQVHDPALIKHTELIAKAARDGAETVRRIHEIGRQDRVDDFIAVDTASILDDCMELTQARATQRDTTIDIDCGDAVRVAANPSELREVLINLVHNACDAMPAGGGSVHLRARRDGDRIIIDVRDTGLGIPADVIGRVFDPYFTTKGESGTGLGLSVSHSIVRRHGGHLRVTSNTTGPERGTTFSIDLPAFVETGISLTAAAATATEGAPGRAKVLVVDDEENIREILAEMLMTADHEVLTAADGAEALHKLQGDPDIDLVFTDLTLPGMNGYEIAQEMKRLRPDLLVGLVTGWGATLDKEKARVYGVDLVISKPFRFEQVLGIVDEALLSRRGKR
jgi:PAS domain S-box-containing protein